MTGTPRLVDKIGQFTTIPTTVINLWPEMGMDAFALFVCLRFHSNEKGISFPSYYTIMAETTLTRNKIAKAIRILETFGLLERRRRFGNSTVYVLTMPPISPVAGLMGEDTVVPQQDYSSPTAGLSVVPQQDANQINLTRLNKPDPLTAPPEHAKKVADAHPSMAERLFREVTGFITIPHSERLSTDIEIMQGLIERFGYDEAKERMSKAWDWWTSCKRQDNGKSYSRTNTKWIDYAMTGDIPKVNTQKEKTNQGATLIRGEIHV